MKIAKKLLVFAMAMSMVLGLVACGGDKYPMEYKTVAPRGVGEQGMDLTLQEDGTYVWTFHATDSKDASKMVMEVEMTGTYEKAEEIVIIITAEGTGYYTAGTERTDFTFDKENPGMYENTDALGSFVFVLAEDGTFGPVTE